MESDGEISVKGRRGRGDEWGEGRILKDEIDEASKIKNVKNVRLFLSEREELQMEGEKPRHSQLSHMHIKILHPRFFLAPFQYHLHT